MHAGRIRTNISPSEEAADAGSFAKTQLTDSLTLAGRGRRRSDSATKREHNSKHLR